MTTKFFICIIYKFINIQDEVNEASSNNNNIKEEQGKSQANANIFPGQPVQNIETSAEEKINEFAYNYMDQLLKHVDSFNAKKIDQ